MPRLIKKKITDTDEEIKCCVEQALSAFVKMKIVSLWLGSRFKTHNPELLYLFSLAIWRGNEDTDV